MRVAIVHDWLLSGGAEHVVEQLHKIYPEAPIYTSFATKEWRKKLDGRVVSGYLQYWPFSKLRKFIPFLRGWWFSSLNLKNFDLIISSSGAEAKFIKVKPPSKHIAYIHAPTHYYWDRYDEYLKSPGLGPFNWLGRIGLKILVGPMRKWDYRAAQRPDYLIANSAYTQKMIKEYYQRESVVIHPPVDVDSFSHHPSSFSIRHSARKGFVIIGRQTPYKRFDLAVAACSKLSLPLTVIGDGPEYKNLVEIAGPSVRFTGYLSEGEKIEFMRSSEAFIFPGLDDFGIVSVEALAAGTPVIAYKAGGALDYITPKNGLFFSEQSVDSLCGALKEFSKRKFDIQYVSQSAEQFNPEKFRAKIKSLIKSL